MDIRTISSHNFIPIIDPVYIKQSPDEFLAENGGFLSEVAVISKSTTGFVHYRSATAPTERTTNEFYSTFSSIADSIGIKVHSFVNGLADSFLAKNPGYSAIKDGGNANTDFIDPNKESYTNYLRAILSEVMAFPIASVIVDNMRFPRIDYSFSEKFCRRFSQAFGIERIFSLSDLQKDANLFANWKNMRSQILESMIKELSDICKQNKIDLNLTLDIDPTLQGSKGAFEQFGQDLAIFGKYGIPTLHLSAWTPYPNSDDTPEFQTLIRNLQFAKDYQSKTQTKLNLYIWGAESESVLGIVDAIGEEIPIYKVFVQNHFPSDYQKRRETHLGLV